MKKLSMDDAFMREYLCEFPKPSRHDLDLQRLALEYHRRTESYDYFICKQKDRGGFGFPTTALEQAMCKRHSEDVREHLGRIAESWNVSRSAWWKAIRDAGHKYPTMQSLWDIPQEYVFDKF